MTTDAAREKAREENRRNFPFAAAALDEMREVFGTGVKLVYAEENGKTVGKKSKGAVKKT